MKKFYGSVLPLLALMLFAGSAYAVSPILKEIENAYVRFGEEVRPCVVNIDVEGTPSADESPLGEKMEDLDEFFKMFGIPHGQPGPRGEGQQRQRAVPKMHGQGSGFIYDKEGHIITNNHVVRDATTITVRLSDGTEYQDATVIGKDADTDLAVIKIDPKGRDLPVARLGDSADLKVGQFAIAVGSPGGLESSVSFGHISALGRKNLQLPSDLRFQDFIQTDAAINLGNSGGPLCDIDGEVIGINVAIVWGAQSLGFAIPVDRVKEIVPVLISKGKITRGYLGVQVMDIKGVALNSGTDLENLLKATGLPDAKGAYVHKVTPDSAAERAGVQVDDVIREINGKTVDDASDLVKQISAFAPGETATLNVLRKGKEEKIRVTLDEFPSSMKEAKLGAGVLGLRIKDLSPEIAKQMDLDAGTKGVLITDVDKDSPADKAGIEPGDVILKIGGENVSNDADFRRLMKEKATPGSPLALRIVHPGGTFALKVLKVPAGGKVAE